MIQIGHNDTNLNRLSLIYRVSVENQLTIIYFVVRD